jgi:RNA polymerase sigma factor (TIGR02999 family)
MRIATWNVNSLKARVEKVSWWRSRPISTRNSSKQSNQRKRRTGRPRRLLQERLRQASDARIPVIAGPAPPLCASHLTRQIGRWPPSGSAVDRVQLDFGEVTRLLRSARSGDPAALDRLVPLLYEDLRRVARLQLGHEYGERTLNPTALVHESYLKLGTGALAARDRAHFLAIAAHAMRQVLVDHARDRKAAKRGGGLWESTTLTDGAWVKEFDPDGVLALDEALAALEPRQRQVVECRFFGGLTEQEIAAALGVTERTVHRDWVKARAWLYRYFYPEPTA